MPPGFPTRNDYPRSLWSSQQSVFCVLYDVVNALGFLPNIRSRIPIKTLTPTFSHPRFRLKDHPSSSRDRPGKDSRDENSAAEGSSQDSSGPQEDEDDKKEGEKSDASRTIGGEFFLPTSPNSKKRSSCVRGQKLLHSTDTFSMWYVREGQSTRLTINGLNEH